MNIKIDSKLLVIDSLPTFKDLDIITSQLKNLELKCSKIDEHQILITSIQSKSNTNQENIAIIEKKLNVFNNLKLNLKD